MQKVPDTAVANGFIIAAPHSGSGKTTLTLGLLRALRNENKAIASAKAGPDFIDPAFHTFAGGHPCINLDPWAMRPELIKSLVAELQDRGLLITEAMMGLFDGAADGSGSAADLAETLDMPIILVVDAAKQSHSIAALVRGFRDHRPACHIAGVLLNKVGSKRHEIMLRDALAAIDMPVLGAIPRDEKMVLPSRHLGLVQAAEHKELEAFIDHASDVVLRHVDLDQLTVLKMASQSDRSVPRLAPPGQRVALAHDAAFLFSYPHLIDGWRAQGAQVLPFSPLADEAPDDDCDSVFLPGGYPELSAGKLSSNANFQNGLKKAAKNGAFVYGECGGFMVLGEALVDEHGARHKMANLLPLITSFETRKLHLGYRLASAQSQLPFLEKGAQLTAHEFHYSTIVSEGEADRLFAVSDARGDDLGMVGLRRANVAGSYMHMIDMKGL